MYMVLKTIKKGWKKKKKKKLLQIIVQKFFMVIVSKYQLIQSVQ